MWTLTVRQTAVLVLLFVVTSVTLIGLDQQQRLDSLRSGTGQIVAPLTTSFNRLGRALGGIGSGNDTELARRLAEVTQERDQLLAENARLQRLEAEVIQLREQLGFQHAHADLEVVPANVVGRDTTGARQFVMIDRGSNHGIEVGMAVVSPNFFVGQVTDVAPDRARVTLAVDVSYQVAATVQRTDADGILYGRWQAGEYFELRHLSPTSDIQEDDLVVTSGKTARVPAGLVIGKVTQIDRNVQADTLTADVAPLMDFSQLQSVTVIRGSGESQ